MSSDSELESAASGGSLWSYGGEGAMDLAYGGEFRITGADGVGYYETEAESPSSKSQSAAA